MVWVVPRLAPSSGAGWRSVLGRLVRFGGGVPDLLQGGLPSLLGFWGRGVGDSEADNEGVRTRERVRRFLFGAGAYSHLMWTVGWVRPGGVIGARGAASSHFFGPGGSGGKGCVRALLTS